MLDPIGQTAVHSLAIDLANLTARLAVYQAAVTQLIQIGDAVDRSTWSREVIEEDSGGGNGVYLVKIPGTEVEKLEVLLASLDALR